jgi:hypothetical protein
VLINYKFISLCYWFEITCDTLVWDYFLSMIYLFMQLLLCFCGCYLLSVDITYVFIYLFIFIILLFLFILYRLFLISSFSSLTWLYYFLSFAHLTIWVHNWLFYYTICCFHLHHASHFTACFTNSYNLMYMLIFVMCGFSLFGYRKSLFLILNS